MVGRWRVVPRPLTFNKTCLESTAMYYSFFRKARVPVCYIRAVKQYVITFFGYIHHRVPAQFNDIFKNMNHLAREE